ncbi:MAG: DUF6198 family protein [Veillonellales bacterium]
MINKLVRYTTFLVGLLFMGLGIGLVTKSSLGTSPISSVPYICSMIFPITFGQFTFLLSILFLLGEIIILKNDFPKGQFLQVLVGPFFGLFTDLGMIIFSFVNPQLYVEKIIALLIGCIILALGVYLQVAANVIINPGEGIVKVIANKTAKDFGSIKIMFDSTLVLSATVISLFVFGTIKGLREGTIVSALLVGYFTKLCSALFKRFDFEEMLNTIGERC